MTIEASHKKLFDDSIAQYEKNMTKTLSNLNGNHLSKNDFRIIHERFKNKIFNDVSIY